MNRVDDHSGRRINQRPGVGLTAEIVQRRELLLPRIAIDLPAIIMVQAGAKTLRDPAGRTLIIPAGTAVAVAPGQTLDVTNHPDATGLYRAVCLACDPGLAARFAVPSPPGRTAIRDMLALPQLPEGFSAAIDHARRAIIDRAGVSDPVAAHRMGEALLWLAELGGGFAAATAPSTAGRVREMLLAAPADPWPAVAVAARLAMSEATLRRRLAAEQQSLSRILTDVRMGCALSLLQMTDMAVGGVAAAVGYDCPSRFAARFRQRFGFAPSAIRGHGD